MGNAKKFSGGAENPGGAAEPSPGGAENPAEPAEPAVGKVEVGARKDFADELRSWRDKRGLTQVALGEKIKYSGSHVSDVERCYRAPTLELARILDRELDLPGTFVRIFWRISLESFGGWFAPVLPFETQASRIQSWDLGSLPGLLQTADYARALSSAGRPYEPDDVIERDVVARMQRQEIFDREHPPFAWFIIDESALRRVYGSKTIMAAQMDKLLEKSAQPNIVIQIMPVTAVDCSGADGSIIVFEFPESPQVGYTEGCRVGRIMQEPDEVARLIAKFDHLRAVALPPRESTRRIAEMRSDYNE